MEKKLSLFGCLYVWRGLVWWLSGKGRLPIQETWVCFQGREDPLEKEMTIHSSILAWEIPWMEESGGATVHGVAKELVMTE